MRLRYDRSNSNSRRFQSTHPLRDATMIKIMLYLQTWISIHAPLTGCDSKYSPSLVIVRTFQSTHPLRDATFLHVSLLLLEPLFQSTHPLRDATLIIASETPAPCIFQSTHPLRDATSLHQFLTTCIYNFNPRTPYGMRQYS